MALPHAFVCALAGCQARRSATLTRGPDARFFGWPGWGVLRAFAGLLLTQTLLFCLVYWGTDRITAERDLRVPVHFAAELAMPFVPGMAWVYMSIYPLFLALPFVLRTRRELAALTAALAVVTLVAGATFLLLPSELAWPPPDDRALGAAAGVFHAADRLNLHYNLLPSLHVALSVACVAALAPRAGWPGSLLLWGWAAAIAVSTLLTHQHHVLDVVTGALLGWAGVRLVYARLVPR